MNRSAKTTLTALLAGLASLTVAPGALAAPAKPVKATALKVTAPPSAVTNASFDATVTAVGKNGKRATTFRGRLALTIDGVSAGPAHVMGKADKGRYVFEDVHASRAGTSAIEARAGKLSGRTAIAVTPGVATAIELEVPEEVVAGKVFEPNVRVVDAQGDAVGGPVELSISPDGECAEDRCSATKVGEHTVTATQGALTASAPVRVATAPIDHLEVKPVGENAVRPKQPAAATSASFDPYSPSTAAAGFRVWGFDAYGNPYGELTAEAKVSANGTSCPSAQCQGGIASPGEQVVRAEARGVSGTSTLRVLGEEQAYAMKCLGLHNFDVNDSVVDGCEYENPYAADHTSPSSAFDLGALPCYDDRSKIEIADQIAWDGRSHPDIAGYASNQGAPIYYTFRTTGGPFCQNDMYLTLHTSSNSSLGDRCIEATVIYPPRTTPDTFYTSGNGTVKLVDDYNYSTGDAYTLKIVNRCWQSSSAGGSVDIAIDGHL